MIFKVAKMLAFAVIGGLLAAVGGAVGVGVGYAMLRGFIAAMPDGTLPTEAELSLNLPVMALAIAATTLSGLLFGCGPAWYASRLDPAETLKEGGRSGSGKMRHRLRQLQLRRAIRST